MLMLLGLPMRRKPQVRIEEEAAVEWDRIEALDDCRLQIIVLDCKLSPLKIIGFSELKQWIAYTHASVLIAYKKSTDAFDD